MASLLDGIKVIDAASFIAGPAAATVMADFGAEVIKIEPPGVGDPYRVSSLAPGNPRCEVRYSWILDNRNKRSLALDLKAAAGREVLYRMVAGADVFVTNLPLPARARLGVEYAALAERNPRLIYASLTAYGEQGPEADNTGFDSTALWARTSLMDMVRPAPDAELARSLPGMGDHPSAISLFAGIMGALFRRERTGEGAYVHTSLLANGAWWNGIQIQAALSGAEFQRRPAREDATSALHNLYRTQDDRWFHLVLIPEAKRWDPFLQAIGRTDLNRDPRFARIEDRHANPRALIKVLDEVFAGAPWPRWKAAFDEHGITYGLVARLRDVPDDVQMHAADVLTPIDEPRAGAGYVVNSPVWIRETPKAAPRLAPELGEHSEEILRDYGFSGADISRLRGAGVIG